MAWYHHNPLSDTDMRHAMSGSSLTAQQIFGMGSAQLALVIDRSTSSSGVAAVHAIWELTRRATARPKSSAVRMLETLATRSVTDARLRDLLEVVADGRFVPKGKEPQAWPLLQAFLRGHPRRPSGPTASDPSWTPPPSPPPFTPPPASVYDLPPTRPSVAASAPRPGWTPPPPPPAFTPRAAPPKGNVYWDEEDQIFVRHRP